MARLATSTIRGAASIAAAGFTASGTTPTIGRAPSGEDAVVVPLANATNLRLIRKAVAQPTGVDYYVKQVIEIDGTPSNAFDICSIQSGSTTWRLRMTTGRVVQLFDSASTNLASSSALTANQAYVFEVYWRVQTATTGLWELRVDGRTIASGTRANFGTAAGTEWIAGKNTTTNSNINLYVLPEFALNDGSGASDNTWVGTVNIITGGGAASGSGSARATGVRTGLGAGSAAGAGSARATGVRTAIAGGAAVGAGSATAAGTRVRFGGGSAAGSGSAGASGVRSALGSGSAAGSGAAVASGVRSTSTGGFAAGAGLASASGVRTTFVGGLAAGSGGASAAGALVVFGGGSASGVGSATAAGVRTAFGSGTAVGVGTSSGLGVRWALGAGVASGIGSASAAGTVSEPRRYPGMTVATVTRPDVAIVISRSAARASVRRPSTRTEVLT